MCHKHTTVVKNWIGVKGIKVLPCYSLYLLSAKFFLFMIMKEELSGLHLFQERGHQGYR
jgi:hypothetical protein